MNWMKPNTKVVVLAAGEGQRAKTLTKYIPKSLLPVNGVPIIKHVIDYWKQHTNYFVFVVNHTANALPAYIESMLPHPLIVRQQEDHGPGPLGALMAAKVFLEHTDRFVVVLGDCLVDGVLSTPEGMGLGVGVIDPPDRETIKDNFSVGVSNNRIWGVKESPAFSQPAELCGMGVYFFRPLIYKYIREGLGLTSLIQTMIDKGETVTPVPLRARYLNVNTVEDLKKWQ